MKTAKTPAAEQAQPTPAEQAQPTPAEQQLIDENLQLKANLEALCWELEGLKAATPADPQQHTPLEQQLIGENLQLKTDLEAMRRELAGLKAATPPATANAPVAETFEENGQQYRLRQGQYFFKHIGRRTALEVLLDDTQYPTLNGLTIRQYLTSYPNSGVEAL